MWRIKRLSTAKRAARKRVCGRHLDKSHPSVFGMRRRALAGVLFLVLLAAFPAARAEVPKEDAVRRFAIELMQHINAARAKVGVQPLALDFALCRPCLLYTSRCV